MAGWVAAVASLAGSYLASQDKKGKSSSSEKRTDEVVRGTVDTDPLLQQLLGTRAPRTAATLRDYAAVEADQRTDGIINNLFTQFRDETLPQIYNAEGQAGVYGSSNAGFMANDAFAKAINQAAELKLATAATYADQDLQDQNQKDAFLTALFGLNQNQNQTSESRGKLSGTQSVNNPEGQGQFVSELITGLGKLFGTDTASEK